MTPRQITLVQTSWDKVVPIKATAAALFYERLFVLDPSLRPLFKSSMEEQGQKLTSMIHIAVKGLSNLDQIVPAVRELGRRHVAYGVKDGHYQTVGTALLWTLKQGLGQEFTPEVEEAWATAYGLLSSVMKDAAAYA